MVAALAELHDDVDEGGRGSTLTALAEESDVVLVNCTVVLFLEDSELDFDKGLLLC